MNFPLMYHVGQVVETLSVDNIAGALEEELNTLNLQALVKPGARIAITAGSRGVANIDVILKQLVSTLQDLGAKPFFIPTMGSHGGGTAEGQLKILRSLRITEENLGAPIHSSMEVVQIGRSRFGFPVFVDKFASEADGIIVLNRIKPHTEFEGPIESGLMKMMAIGMGKHRGCLEVHKQTVKFGYRDVIPEIGRIIKDKLPILFGIGIVENIYDKTALIKAILPEHFEAEESRLLAKAKILMARLPFENIDVLVIDQMGKNISGTGMDTNVIGRIMFTGEAEPERPKITRIVVLDLTPESHGNAIGVGLADYTTERLLGKMDRKVTATNAITAMTPEKGRMPIALETDRAAVEAALVTIGAVEPENARLIHIKNTLEMSELHISQALFEQIGGRRDLDLIRELGPLSFDERGAIHRVAP
jgi:hypothetical protein